MSETQTNTIEVKTATGNDSPATQATSAAANTAAGSFVVIVLWLLSLGHIEVPGTVAVAMGTLIGIGVHYYALKFGIKSGS